MSKMITSSSGDVRITLRMLPETVRVLTLFRDGVQMSGPVILTMIPQSGVCSTLPKHPNKKEAT